MAGYLSQKYHTTITVKGVSIAFFNKVTLEEVLIQDQKNDSLIYVQELVASIDSFSMKNRYFTLGQLKLNKTYLNINSDSIGTPNYKFLISQFTKKDTIQSDSLKFDFVLNKFEFNDSKLRYAYRDSSVNYQLSLDDISFGMTDLKINDKKMAFQITRFKMTNRKDFDLEDFSAQLVVTPDSVFLNNLHLRTSNSEITEANLRIDKSKIGPELDFKKLAVNLDLKKSRISLKDVGLIVPSLKGMDENIEVSGQVSGTFADLKGKNIELSLGNNTRLAFDLYLNGLPDFATTYMHIDLKQSFADLNDLVRVKLPDQFPLKQIVIPPSLLQAGIIGYNGNFTGFLSDFVAYGTFRSKWGVLTTDLSFVPSKGEQLKINGRLKTVNFQLGQLVQLALFDRITFNGAVKGILNQQTHDFMAAVSGKIDSINVNNYQYENIQLNGDILNKRFNGSLLANDPNLKFQFNGEFDLNVPVPVFNFNMLVEKADLKALNLVSKFKKSAVSFALNANFTGNNIDNLAGYIHFKEGAYQNENGLMSFDNFDLKTFNENEPVLQVRSDFLDADIRGQYQLHNLHYTIQQIIAKYLPSSGLTSPDQKTQNNFDFRLNLKDINHFTQVLIPDLKMNPAEMVGSINSENNTLTLNASFPEIQYQSAVFRKFTVNVNSDSKLNMRNKIEEIDVGEQFKIYNLSLISEASDDVLDSKLAWNNFDAVSYSGSVNTSTRFFKQKNSPHVEISVKPTRLFLADSLWQINSALITIDSSLIKINKFRLSNKSQSIMADGSIDNNQNDKLNISFNQIDLSSLNRLIAGDIGLKGELDGTLSVFDIYQHALYLADLKIDGFGLLGQPIGDAGIQSRWNREEKEIDTELMVKTDQRNSLLAYGIYNPGKDSVSINTNFDHFSILILQPLLGSTFANFHGEATGKVRIYGSPDHLQHDGALFAGNAGLMLSELQVNYNLNDSVRFSGDKIIFPDMKVQDDYGNSGIFSGTIKHRSFTNMIYDLTVKTNKILAINTTPEINEQFYGKLFGSGLLRVTGTDASLLIEGNARTEKGTDMNISLDYEGNAEEYDFLSFVSHNYQSKSKIRTVPVSSSNLWMKFNVELTPEAKAQLIYNSKIGDVIRSQGSGNMQVTIDNKSNLSLFGSYTVEQGDYLFTLQNVINKKFEIQRGGTIEWNGDPLDATINLNAIYRLKASLNDLYGTNEYNNPSQPGKVNPIENRDLTKRQQVLCKIALSKSLNNPEIRFDIELPSAAEQIKDDVRQHISSEEDMNKQILSLLVLGKFYTPEYVRGSYLAVTNNPIGSTASELLSNQFSNWLSQISNDFDIGVNYRPGNAITNDEIELALSTQMFNDRVSINGNIGNNSSQRTNANNNGLVGDADVNVKLTNNGKLQLKAYNHANNNLIYETSPYTQGVGITYREDFNSFNGLWQKIRNIFRRKVDPSQK
ncbi:MAG: translocation/assembly module TamB domain-containing protein [Bacteroidota bacterium]|nr:translocation/assembly module TamB domain-containing protein [Bacteroidota bacterium]